MTADGVVGSAVSTVLVSSPQSPQARTAPSEDGSELSGVEPVLSLLPPGASGSSPADP